MEATAVKTLDIPRRVFPLGAIAARDNGRYAIHGVNVESDGKQATAVATDGRRLIAATFEATEVIPSTADGGFYVLRYCECEVISGNPGNYGEDGNHGRASCSSGFLWFRKTHPH